MDAGGLRVHIAEAGSGDPLVMQHGWPQHWLAWSKLIPRLAESYRVICPDLRGLGWTDAPPTGYEKEQLASDLLALLDALELERVRLVGHDWGGFAAFLACLRAPERFERFCCLGITTPVDAGVALAGGLRAHRLPAADREPRPGTARRAAASIPLVLKRGSGGRSPWTAEEKAAFVDQFQEPERAGASVQIYRTFLRRELQPDPQGPLRGRAPDACPPCCSTAPRTR